MLLRALCGLSFLLGGCAIHVVDQPVTPAALGPVRTVEVAEAPQGHRPPRHHSGAEASPVAEPPTQSQEAPHVARPARSDLTAHPVASQTPKPSGRSKPSRPGKPSRPDKPSKPSRPDKPENADEPLYKRFRDVGPQALPEPQSPVTPKPQPQSRRALKAGS